MDKSLVLAERQEGGEWRYRLLESVHQYAQEMLVEANEVPTLRDGHLAYHLELAETSAPKLFKKEQASTLNHLRSELDNLRLVIILLQRKHGTALQNCRIPALLEAFAKIAVLQGLEERAARLFGAANVSRDRFEIPIPPVDVWEYEASIATLCNSLGEACLEKLLQEGRAIPLDEAVTYALKTDGE